MSKPIVSLIVISCLFVLSLSGTCGGNCPDDSCKICPCGSTPKMIDIETYCKSFSDWDSDCCKCIVERETKGNAHYSQKNDYWPIGSYYMVGALPITSRDA